MKPTSIIFLLISLVIILVGWIICNSAESTAAADGIPIFDSAIDADKNAISKLNFDPEEIYNKIDLVADDADVYISGGYSEPYMELVNFRDGSYRHTTANRNITVDTTIDLSSIIRFWESGFSFRGLRNYLHRTDTNGQASKRINVYLPTDGDVNIINVTLGSGSVYISNFDTSIDINVKIGEGDLTVSTFSTTSSIVSEIDHGGIYLRDVKVGKLEALLPEGNMTAEGFEFGDINISGNSANISLDIVPGTPDFSMNLSARHGAVTLFGERRGSSYAHEVPGAAVRAMITVSSGDILINYGAERRPVSSGGDAADTSAADTAGGAGTSAPEGEPPQG